MRGIASLVLWVGLAALAALPLQQLARSLRLPRACDTTYLWEGYEEVALEQPHARYKLFMFRDGDPERQTVYEQLQRRHVVPVLFVHGHLGSHQQMRSAASEAGRELARRLDANGSWPLWHQWYGADFAAEPSALDARILDRQVGFVLRCINHLQQVHSGGERQPFRLVLVAYSMGASVATEVVRRLAASPELFDLDQLVAFVSLGSPRHFPRFMPHMALLKHAGSPAESERAAAAATATAAVPSARILAGVGDYSSPLTHAYAAPPEPLANGLDVLMQDVPGVWTTAGHKAIVSCNQLVRQLVPLLIDATMAALNNHGSAGQQWDAVQQSLRNALTTGMARALHLPAAVAAAVPPERSNCAAAASHLEPPEQVGAGFLVREVSLGSSLHLTWDAQQLRAAGKHGVLLLAMAAPACSHWAVQAELADGRIRQHAARAAVLPPLMPALQARWVPRHWQDVMRGIDWRQNATRLLYIPFEGDAAAAGRQAQPLLRVDVAMRGGEGGATSLLAQVLDHQPWLAGEAGSLQLPLSVAGRGAELPPGHAAVLALRLPQHLWPVSKSAACSPGSRASLGCLAVLLLGTTPPWDLRIESRQCGQPPSSSAWAQRLLPAVVGMQAGGRADSVRVAAAPDSGSAVLHLWDGIAPLDGLLLVSDPRCAYSLRLHWNLGGWLGLSLRHLAFVLPALCIAVAQARLGALAGSAARVIAASAVLAAWGSLHPSELSASTGGLHPWLRLSVVEAGAALLLAAGAAHLLGGLLMLGLRLVRRMLPTKQPSPAWLPTWAPALPALIASSMLHPSLPAYLGCLALAVRLAAASKWGPPAAASRTSERGAAAGTVQAWPEQPLAWLRFYGLLALLPSVDVFVWLAGGRLPGWEWSDGRLLVLALALHACLGCGVGQRAARRSSLAAAAGHEAAACLAATASLWGHPCIALHAAAATCAASILLRG